MTYALRTCKDGDLFGLRWKRDERAVVPSYASEGTRKPTSGGSKSSYSRRLCRPRKKEARPIDGDSRCRPTSLGHRLRGRMLVEQGGPAHPRHLLRGEEARSPRPTVGRQGRPRSQSHLLLRTLPATARRYLDKVRRRPTRERYNDAVPFVVLRGARSGGQEGFAPHLGQRFLARLQRGQAMARQAQPPRQKQRRGGEDGELPSSQAEPVAERHRAQVGSWETKGRRIRRPAGILRARRQGLRGVRLSSSRASLHSPGGRLIMH